MHVQSSSRYVHAHLFVHMLIKSSNGGLTIKPLYTIRKKGKSTRDVESMLTNKTYVDNQPATIRQMEFSIGCCFLLYVFR